MKAERPIPNRQLANVAAQIQQLREEVQLLAIFARQARNAAIEAEIVARRALEEGAR